MSTAAVDGEPGRPPAASKCEGVRACVRKPKSSADGMPVTFSRESSGRTA